MKSFHNFSVVSIESLISQLSSLTNRCKGFHEEIPKKNNLSISNHLFRNFRQLPLLSSLLMQIVQHCTCPWQECTILIDSLGRIYVSLYLLYFKFSPVVMPAKENK